LQSVAEQAVARSGTSLPPSPSEAAYWGYHSLRSSWFLGQGILGLTASGVMGNPLTGARREAALSQARSLFSEAMMTFAQDLRNIKAGLYRAPWDASDLRHRQFNPLRVAMKTAMFVREARRTLERRKEGKNDEVWLSGSFYPDYYQAGFHYQSDGWLSSASAKVYESSTETLFLGRQDAMQRHALIPINAFMLGRDPSETRLLEVGCGTGRFHTFVKDNFRIESTAVDLSPYYLEEARQNDRYWRKFRGVPEGTARTQFVQAPAEQLPFADASFDVAVAVYLFHELPREAREAAARELARVLRPGGVCVLCDSVQLGDRLPLDPNLHRFGDFNEPHYKEYINDDLGKLFAEVGLEPDSKEIASSTKVLSWRKPAQSPPSPL